MRTAALTHSPLRELASRTAGGTETTLFWDARTGTVTVSVWNRNSGELLQFAAPPGKALHAFYHPYAYAAAIGVAACRPINRADKRREAP